MRVLLMIGLLLVGCGKQSATEKTDVPREARVELLAPRAGEVVYPASDFLARLDSSAAGDPRYWINLSWSTKSEGEQAAWFIHIRGQPEPFFPELQHPGGVAGNWHHGPFRRRLAAGVEHVIEVRALVGTRTRDRLKCPFVVKECPMVQRVWIDLTVFK